MFPELLRYYRERQGFSQNQLAKKAGLTGAYVCRLEAGKRKPSREAVINIGVGIGLGGRDTDQLLLAADFRPTDLASMMNEPRLFDLDAMIALVDPQTKEEIQTVVTMALQRGRSSFLPESKAA